MNSYLLYRVISSYGKLLDRFYLMCFRMVVSVSHSITAFYKTVIQIQLVMFSVYIRLVVFRKSVLVFPIRFICPARKETVKVFSLSETGVNNSQFS